MKKIYIYSSLLIMFVMLFFLLSCGTRGKSTVAQTNVDDPDSSKIKVEAENLIHSSQAFEVNTLETGESCLIATADGWIALDVDVAVAGRYKSQVRLFSGSGETVSCWIEDYYDNKDNRTYNITGSMQAKGPTSGFVILSKDGSPLNTGLHKMKLHFDSGVIIDWVGFDLIRPHEKTPLVMRQKTDGDQWSIVWSDEFEGTALDTSLWTYDIGDWGWGNNELQYYTENNTDNARLENGNLVIEARLDDVKRTWTSARLTTRGKVSFIYGKIEFRAKVPSNRGNWAAGWTLGDDYVDELSWPYCGEIDILESVGYEMDDETGNGKAHASAHSGAYYFKLGNQPTGIVDVENMNNAYHNYAVEWTPDGIKAFVDDRLYITYNDTSTDLSWPFDRPQNIILNLAMGGGWGGAHGMDDNITSQKMIIDYVRVYERK